MRQDDAIYRGEMSAHNYSRDFYYADSRMIPWLLIAQLVSHSGKSLAELVEDRMTAFPCSGEINFRVADVAASIAKIEAGYAPTARSIDRADGLSLELRLNVASSGDVSIAEQRTRELKAKL